jgi:hypothetical protein
MSLRPQSRVPPGRLLLGATFVALSCLPLAAKSAGPAPYELALQVVYGDDSLGSESLREDAERWIFRETASHGCYAEMERYGAHEAAPGQEGPDLLLRVTLTNLDVHETWDVSLADRTSPDHAGEDMSNRVTATVAFDVDMVLLVMPEEATLRHREFRHQQSYRPSMGEDPREAVRLLVLEDLAREIRGFACKGTKKLPRQIEQAKGQADN